MIASHDNTFNPLSHYGHYTTITPQHISHTTHVPCLQPHVPICTTTNFILFSTLPIPHDLGLSKELGICLLTQCGLSIALFSGRTLSSRLQLGNCYFKLARSSHVALSAGNCFQCTKPFATNLEPRRTQ
jgi:hypothetical protein